MLSKSNLTNLYLNPDIPPDQYQDVRVITVKSEYARVLWETAMNRVGNNTSKIIAETSKILDNNEITLSEFVTRKDGLFTVCVNTDTVNDDNAWLTAVALLSKATEYFENRYQNFTISFGPVVSINKLDLPWFGYH